MHFSDTCSDCSDKYLKFEWCSSLVAYVDPISQVAIFGVV